MTPSVLDILVQAEGHLSFGLWLEAYFERHILSTKRHLYSWRVERARFVTATPSVPHEQHSQREPQSAKRNLTIYLEKYWLLMGVVTVPIYCECRGGGLKYIVLLPDQKDIFFHASYRYI